MVTLLSSTDWNTLVNKVLQLRSGNPVRVRALTPQEAMGPTGCPPTTVQSARQQPWPEMVLSKYRPEFTINHLQYTTNITSFNPK